MVCITATIGTKRHKKGGPAVCSTIGHYPGTAIRPESKIERDRDGISFYNWHALLWDTVHIFSQERQRRSKPRATGSPSSILLRFPFWLQTGVTDWKSQRRKWATPASETARGSPLTGLRADGD